MQDGGLIQPGLPWEKVIKTELKIFKGFIFILTLRAHAHKHTDTHTYIHIRTK